MPHLLKIRKGWENEILAEYIFSKFCFVAKPSSTGQDVGMDLFCTMFDVVEDKYLIPKPDKPEPKREKSVTFHCYGTAYSKIQRKNKWHTELL